MKRLLVIGMGSLIMQDDGVGSRIVQEISPLLLQHEIAAIVGETDFAYCFNSICEDDFLVLIDAMQTGAAPATISILPLCNALKDRGSLRTQHDFSLFDNIALHHSGAKGYFIGIETADIDFGLELSPRLQQHFEAICAFVLNTIINIKEEAKNA